MEFLTKTHMSSKPSFKRTSIGSNNDHNSYTLSTLPSQNNQTVFLPSFPNEESICKSCCQTVTRYLRSKERQMITIINTLENLWIKDKDKLAAYSISLSKLSQIEKQKQDLLLTISTLQQTIKQLNTKSIIKPFDSSQVKQNILKPQQFSLTLLEKNINLTNQLQKELDFKAQLLSQIQLLKDNCIRINSSIKIQQLFIRLNVLIENSIGTFYDSYS